METGRLFECLGHMERFAGSMTSPSGFCPALAKTLSIINKAMFTAGILGGSYVPSTIGFAEVL